MTTTYEIIQHAVSIPCPCTDMTETYVRSWRERLLTWPLRPFQRTGTRPTVFAMLVYAQANARDEMLRITGIPYEMLGA